jgi:protein TonB
MLQRYLVAFGFAIVIVTILVAILITLIKTSEMPIADGNALTQVNFIRERKDPDLELETFTPEPPPVPSEPPPPAKLQVDTMDPMGQNFEIAQQPVMDDFSFEPGLGMGVGEGDGEYLPIYRVPPQYPRQALFDRTEGWVVVEFTIGTEGQVKNARVIKAQPRGVFEQAALQAVQRFRFKPRNVAGMPVEVHGVQNRIRFKLKR